MTQNEKLLNFFRSGKNLTESQAEGLFGIQNLSARVAELRAEGHAIYTNKLKSGTTAYRLGTANRAMVSAAYLIAGPSVFA